jgi:hypothetical protein
VLAGNAKILLVDVLIHLSSCVGRLHARDIRVSDLCLVAMSLLLVLIFNINVGTILDISQALLSLSRVVLCTQHLALFSVVELSCFDGIDINHLATIWVKIVATCSFSSWWRIEADSCCAIGKTLVESELPHVFHS